MTISAQPRKAGPYAGNGVAASFAFTFKVFAAADVRVLRTDGQGLEVLLLLGADYSVVLNPDQNAAPGGQVALPVPLPVGEKVTIIGSLPIEQPLALTNNGGFYPAVVNAAFDRQTILAQQNAEQIARALKFQASDDPASVGELPQKTQRAGRVLAFESGTGKPVAGPTIAAVGSVSSASAAIEAVAASLDDIAGAAGNAAAAQLAQAGAESARNLAQGYATAAAASAQQAADAAPVQSVAGRTGDVTLVASDIGGLGTAASADSSAFATATQGGKADSALQPNAGLAAIDSAANTKLGGIAAGATANATDAQLRDRGTHTGTQAIATVNGLQAALDGKQPANANIQSHISSTENPHGVTKIQIGLGNVDNTADVNKSVDSILSKDTRGVSNPPSGEKSSAITLNLKGTADVDYPPVSNGLGTAHIINISAAPSSDPTKGSLIQLSVGYGGIAFRGAQLLDNWTTWAKMFNSKDIIPVVNGGTGVSSLTGKVLDDLTVINDFASEIDGLMTPGGYIVKVDELINGGYSGATILVASNGGVISQIILSPIVAKVVTRFYIGGWTDWLYGISTADTLSWYDDTTAEAANAVINADGTFSRSVSSEDYKTGIEPMLDEYADAIVQGTQPIYYRSTCEADPDDLSYWGISAEQLATIDPRLVHWGHSTKEVPQPLGLPPKTVPDLDSPLKPVGVQYSRIVPALLNVLKRQGVTIASLEARVSALEGGAA